MDLDRLSSCLFLDFNLSLTMSFKSAFSSNLSNECLSGLSHRFSGDLLEYRDFDRSFLELASGLCRRDFDRSTSSLFLFLP